MSPPALSPPPPPEIADKIAAKLLANQGNAMDIGGYVDADEALAEQAMRPSGTLSAVIDGM